MRDLPKLGYKGVESCELRFEGYRCPSQALLGPAEGRGFSQMMTGLEIGRIQLDAIRIQGNGYSLEYDVERYFRDAPLMIVGEGTNEIQKKVITAQLISRGGLT